MFDAKSILEGLVRGAAPQTSGQQGSGGLADILGQVLGGGQSGAGGQGGGLSDILGEIQKQLTQGGGSAPGPRGAVESRGGAAQGGSSGGFGDILGQLKDALGPQGGAPSGGGGTAAGGGGSIMDVLGQVLSQATAGAKEGATRIGEATGASDALGRATGGQSPEELLEKLRQLVRDNPLASAGAAGGLGGLILGTRAGRALAGSAVRLGALAMIGGLAYKAYQNYQTGKPLVTGAEPAQPAPEGSGFEPDSVTNETAMLYIKAMFAAAAADGRVDAAEQQKLVGSLKQAGMDAEAETFLANELNNPASVEDLARAVRSPAEAVQVYTAARLAIEPDAQGEAVFLAKLATALGIDPGLAAHIDATTRGAA